MKLPQISYPTYEVKVLSRKKPVEIRPFTVREEKLMLMAHEAKDIESTIRSIKQIIQNCVLDPEYDVANMAMIDMEVLFLHLRAHSVGERDKTYFKCTNQVEGTNGMLQDCGMLLDVEIDFLHIPVINADLDKTIQLTDKIGVVMKYPSFTLIEKLAEIQPEDVEYSVAALCLEKIYDENSVYEAKDCTYEELIAFVDQLPGDKYEKIKKFIDNVPKTSLNTTKDCVKCGFHHVFKLEGLDDFFV